MTRRERVALYDTPLSDADQRRALGGARTPVAVYGLGKMGLPLAAVYADCTGAVVGVDVDPDVVERVNRGECPVEGEPRLPELVARTVADGSLEATTDHRRAAERARIHVVIVPTGVRGTEPDLSALFSVTEHVGAELDDGDLVVVECTVPPGTCRNRVLPTLERASGRSLGEFGLAFCPERTSSGRAVRDVRGAHPKIVGGADAESTRAATLVYDELTDNEVVPVSDLTTAECVKVFEGVYRDVNIALANELATFVDDLDTDVTEAIEAANTQPYCDIHRPGAGVGGHCIPYYPYFLTAQVSGDASLLHTARRVNDAMPGFVVRKLREGLARTGTTLDGASVLLLGLAYRPGVNETRKSPARPIARRLSRLGATVHGVDPVVDGDGFDLRPTPLADVPDLDVDAAVLVTAHEAFDRIDWTAFPPLVVVDGRQALDLADTDHRVYTVGQGWNVGRPGTVEQESNAGRPGPDGADDG
ncbi:MAG: nucleotide sugar dehydrogenase [Haloferacaceae archaeon]